MAKGECHGHESTSGPIGQTVYCDGRCNPGYRCDECDLYIPVLRGQTQHDRHDESCSLHPDRYDGPGDGEAWAGPIARNH